MDRAGKGYLTVEDFDEFLRDNGFSQKQFSLDDLALLVKSKINFTQFLRLFVDQDHDQASYFTQR